MLDCFILRCIDDLRVHTGHSAAPIRLTRSRSRSGDLRSRSQGKGELAAQQQREELAVHDPTKYLAESTAP